MIGMCRREVITYSSRSGSMLLFVVCFVYVLDAL